MPVTRCHRDRGRGSEAVTELDRAQLKSTVTGPMPKAHIRTQLKSTSKLIASCTNRLAAGAIVAEAAASCNLNDAEGS